MVASLFAQSTQPATEAFTLINSDYSSSFKDCLPNWDRESTLVLLAVPTGMRRCEALATQGCDIDCGKKTLNVRKSIWQQRLGR